MQYGVGVHIGETERLILPRLPDEASWGQNRDGSANPIHCVPGVGRAFCKPGLAFWRVR
jgi:hypothetical protein